MENCPRTRFRTALKKSATNTPRVELVEIGPSIDFVIDRTRLASENLFKTALRKPKQLKVLSFYLARAKILLGENAEEYF